MNKTLLLFAALILTANAAVADEAAKELTVAAAESSARQAWIETEEDAQLRLEEDLAAKSDALNDQASTDLEQKLADRLARDLDM